MVSSDYALFGPFVIVRYNSGGSDLHGPWSWAELWFMDHTSFYLSISKNSNVILFSFSFNFWKEKKRKEKKNHIISFFESLRDSVWEGFVDASPWNFVSNKAHQGAFSSFFCFLFCFCFCAFVFFFFYYYYFFPYVLYLYSLFISTSEIFIEKFLAKYHCILYLSFNILNDSRKKELTQKINGLPIKVKKETLFVFF